MTNAQPRKLTDLENEIAAQMKLRKPSQKDLDAAELALLNIAKTCWSYPFSYKVGLLKFAVASFSPSNIESVALGKEVLRGLELIQKTKDEMELIAKLKDLMTMELPTMSDTRKNPGREYDFDKRMVG